MALVGSNTNRRYLAILAVLAGALILMWPAVLNGGPFLATDTASYFRSADTVAVDALGTRSAWSGQKVGAPESAIEPVASSPMVAGKPTFYGAALYLTLLSGSFWLMAAIQALIVSFCIFLTLSAINFGARRTSNPGLYLLVLLATAALSPVAYFTSFMRPDIFAAVLVLAFGNLLCLDQATSRGRAAWCALATVALLFHDALYAIAITIILIVLVLRLFGATRIPRHGLKLTGLALLLGMLGNVALHAGVTQITGSAPIEPPVVTARLVSDGPGLRYLQESCPQNGFYLCHFLAAMPNDSDDFLFSEKPARGLFSVISYPGRRQLADEQFDFVSAVILDRPGEVIESSARNVLSQVGKSGLSEFNYVRPNGARMQASLPPRFAERARRTAAFENRMPVRPTEMLAIPAMIGSLLLMIGLLMKLRSPDRRKLTIFGWVLLIGWLANDIVSAVFSAPVDRHQMSMIWIFVPAALAIALRTSRIGAPQLPAKRSTVIVTVEPAPGLGTI